MNFVIAPGTRIDLTPVIADLRAQIRAGKLAKAAQKIYGASAEEVYVEVVQTQEEPHTHPNNDLTVVVLSGAGFLETGEANLPVKAEDSAVIPKGMCHAYHNDPVQGDSVLLAVFTPAPPHQTVAWSGGKCK